MEPKEDHVMCVAHSKWLIVIDNKLKVSKFEASQGDLHRLFVGHNQRKTFDKLNLAKQGHDTQSE